MQLFKELQRRNVFRVAVGYIVSCWLLVQVADLVLENIGAPAWVMQTIMLLLALGFPVLVFFSWAYEVTPEGIKHESKIRRSESITQVTGRKLDLAITAVLVIALAYFAFDKFVLSSGRDVALIKTTAQAVTEQDVTEKNDSTLTSKSIAVLPFVNMSDDESNEYFSEGISEEILNAMAKVKDLKVVGRTSSFAFKGRNEDLRTIGEALGVTHILEGSVRKVDRKVRITAQLIKADDGFHVWSDTYDRQLEDIFAIQDEIAQAIFAQLKLHLIGDEGAIQFASPRADLSAFDLYLDAKQKIYLRKRASLEQAAELLEQAIEVDPNYAPAFAQRGIVFLLLRVGAYGTIPAAVATEQAKLTFDRALLLDPESAEAWAGLGLYLHQTGEPEQAIEALRRALAINPSMVNARNWLANSLVSLSHLEEAKQVRLEVLIRDPLYLPGISNALDDYFLYGDIEQAQALIDRIRPYMPASRIMTSFEGVLHFVAGRVAESMPYFESAQKMEPDNRDLTATLSRALLCSWQYERLAAEGLDEYRVNALMRLNRSEDASILAWQLATKDNKVWPLFALLVEQGRHDELIDYFESRWPDLQSFEVDFPERDGWSEHNYLGLIAFSYQKLGKKEKYEKTMSRFKAAQDYQRHIGAKNHWFAFSEAVYAVLAGDHETALGRLAKAFEGGFAVDPQLSKTWPMFEPLNNDPRYEAIMNRMVEHMNSERAKLRLESVGQHNKPLT